MKRYKKISHIAAGCVATALLSLPALCAFGASRGFCAVVAGCVADTAGLDTVAADTAEADGGGLWPLNVQSRLDMLLKSDMFETSTVGLMVYDLTADSVIYRYNEKQLMRPASTLKMMVAVAALDRLGKDYQYSTALYNTGHVEGGVLHGADGLCVVRRPITDILPRMMKRSDNLYSESVFYQLAASAGQSAHATAKQGRRMMNRLIGKIGYEPSEYYIADGSGLSLYNYVSPELEVGFLRYAYRDDDIYIPLYQVMPIAGEDGTLDKRMRHGHAHGNVHAKTGTVTGVSALAGYCTAANGHTLCFSIINMGIRKASIGRGFQDRVCEALCRP